MLCTREQASCLISGTGWEWDDGAEWTLDHAQGDVEGWEYAFCFGFGFEWHDTCGMTDCVRRRAWIRRLRKSQSSGGDSSPCRVTHLRASLQPSPSCTSTVDFPPELTEEKMIQEAIRRSMQVRQCNVRVAKEFPQLYRLHDMTSVRMPARSEHACE